MNAGGFPYLTLRWLTAGSTCVHIQSSTEKCGSIWRTVETSHVHNCDPACAIMHTPSPGLFIFLHEDNHNVADIQSKYEIGICRKYVHGILYMYWMSFVVYIISLIHAPALRPLSLLFSPADPIFAVLWYREVMMRNGVIMPVVKPQAAQQMCFRDPAFVSEWIRSLLWYPLYLISLQSLPATLCFSW